MTGYVIMLLWSDGWRPEKPPVKKKSVKLEVNYGEN